MSEPKDQKLNPNSNDRIKSAHEIRELLSNIHGKRPKEISICDLCISIDPDKQSKQCFIGQNEGEIPKKGYCRGFEVSPDRDPRNEKNLTAIIQQKVAKDHLNGFR